MLEVTRASVAVIAESAAPIASTKASLLLAAALRRVGSLDLGQRLFFYGVVVGRVGRQIKELAALLLEMRGVVLGNIITL